MTSHSFALNTCVYNEIHRIAGLLSYAGTFCDELIVVDGGSTDGTADFARALGATVIDDTHHGLAEPSRPVAEAHSHTDWIVYLDADEVFAYQYFHQLLTLPDSYDVCRLSRASYIDGGRWHWKADRQTRMWRKGAVEFGLTPHSRIEPREGMRVFDSPDGEDWMIHAKAGWEHDRQIERQILLGTLT